MKILILLALLAIFLIACPDVRAGSPSQSFNIVDFGAIADGQTVNTAAIQKALDACSQAGGGIVRVPSGTYLTGSLRLQDNDTLSLEAGATLLGSGRIQDYPTKDVIQAKGVKNITILGPGAIDGQGHLFWTFDPNLSKSELRNINFSRIHYWKHNEQNSGDLVALTRCSNVKLSGVTLQNSQSWTCNLLDCDNVSVDSIRIRNPLNGPNTDGIDVDGCQNVLISNCDICTGDDAVCLKNRSNAITYPHSCKNITVSHCTLVSPTNGFKIGTESYGDFENIVFEDSIVQAGDPNSPWCADAVRMTSPKFYGDALGPEAGIAVESVDGAHISGVTVKNIIMHNVQSPIFVRLGSRGINPTDESVKAPTGTLEGVSISNVTADGAWGPSIIAGVPGHPVQNVSISDVHITNIGKGTSSLTALTVPEKETGYPSPLMFGPLPAHSLFIRHADGIKFTDYSVTNAWADTRQAVIIDDVDGLQLVGLGLDPVASSDHLLVLNNVRNANISGTVPQNTKTWATVSGAESSNITLEPGQPGNAGQVLALVGDVPSTAVTVK